VGQLLCLRVMGLPLLINVLLALPQQHPPHAPMCACLCLTSRHELPRFLRPSLPHLTHQPSRAPQLQVCPPL
jgi:hypothetical protein